MIARRYGWVGALALALMLNPGQAWDAFTFQQSDLTVSVIGPTSFRPGDEVESKIIIEVSNIGGASAPGTNEAGSDGYMIDLVLSTDEVLPVEFAVFSPNFSEDVLLRGGRFSNTPTLKAGESAIESSGEALLPEDTPPGRYCLGLVVDPGQRVTESDETNNTACHWIDIADSAAVVEQDPLGEEREENACPVTVEALERMSLDEAQGNAPVERWTAYPADELAAEVLRVAPNELLHFRLTLTVKAPANHELGYGASDGQGNPWNQWVSYAPDRSRNPLNNLVELRLGLLIAPNTAPSDEFPEGESAVGKSFEIYLKWACFSLETSHEVSSGELGTINYTVFGQEANADEEADNEDI